VIRKAVNKLLWFGLVTFLLIAAICGCAHNDQALRPGEILLECWDREIAKPGHPPRKVVECMVSTPDGNEFRIYKRHP